MKTGNYSMKYNIGQGMCKALIPAEENTPHASHFLLLCVIPFQQRNYLYQVPWNLNPAGWDEIIKL